MSTRWGLSGWNLGLRFWLLALLMPGVVALLLYDSWEDYWAMRDITENVYDSALLEPAKILETSVEFNTDGSLRIDPPFYAQVMLESRPGNRKYFKVEEIVDADQVLAGAVLNGIKTQKLIGVEGLPRPKNLADHEGMPVFYDGFYRNDTLRMVALWRDLYHKGVHRQIVVMVGESLDMRLRTQQEALRESLYRNIRMVALAVLLVWCSVAIALWPLNALRQEVRSRERDDLSPLDLHAVPREVVPLVSSVNHHIDLYRQVLDKQAQFLADASHQLRTPLAIIQTQVQYARREPDLTRVRESLAAINKQLGQANRLTEQLLSMAHASQTEVPELAPVDLYALGKEMVLQYVPWARERSQDIGWREVDETSQGSKQIWVQVNDAEVHEALSNLLHNAISHAGPHSQITVYADKNQTHGWVSVVDDGIGLAASLRDSVFVRFDRGGPASRGAGSGSGLGLAIALTYAQRNGGTIELSDGDPNELGGHGLCATLRFPLLPSS